VKEPQFVRVFVAIAVLALAAAVGASAAPPSPSVTCVAGGKTSFAHPPHGTTNVMFVYGTATATVQWVGGQRSFATPTDVTSGTVVVAAFNDGGTQLDTAQTTCS
jgi:hypothetical protein